MKYIWLFLITFILALIIMFYRPYLGSYKDSVSFDYNNDDNIEWKYETNSDKLEIVSSSLNIFKFIPKKSGKIKLVFYHVNEKNEKANPVTYEFFVLNKRIIWLKGEGIGMFDFPNPY